MLTLVVQITATLLISAHSPNVGSVGNNHNGADITFAHGGMADFRGFHNKFSVLLSAPGIQFASKMSDTTFLLPQPQLVHGSFFTEVAWVLRGKGGSMYGIFARADKTGFDVWDVRNNVRLHSFKSWNTWEADGLFVRAKEISLMARSNGWEVNVTRTPIDNHIAGDYRWRFGFMIGKLDGTVFEETFGASSATCYPHGIIGQSWDADIHAIDGARAIYKYNPDHPEITIEAQAEGAIEGVASDYTLHGLLNGAFTHDFKFSRFYNKKTDVCSPRNIEKL